MPAGYVPSVDVTDVPRAQRFAAPTGTIRCELAPSHARLAGALLESFVHHQCVLADCDVATVDALEAAVAEVADAVADRLGDVTQIELNPDTRFVDIRLSIDPAGHPTGPGFREGPAAHAARLRTSFERDGRLRLVHRFTKTDQR